MAVLFLRITLLQKIKRGSEDPPRSKGGEMSEISTQEVELIAEGRRLGHPRQSSALADQRQTPPGQRTPEKG
jgi:hypothetical protein